MDAVRVLVTLVVARGLLKAGGLVVLTGIVMLTVLTLALGILALHLAIR